MTGKHRTARRLGFRDVFLVVVLVLVLAVLTVVASCDHVPPNVTSRGPARGVTEELLIYDSSSIPDGLSSDLRRICRTPAEVRKRFAAVMAAAGLAEMADGPFVLARAGAGDARVTLIVRKLRKRPHFQLGVQFSGDGQVLADAVAAAKPKDGSARATLEKCGVRLSWPSRPLGAPIEAYRYARRSSVASVDKAHCTRPEAMLGALEVAAKNTDWCTAGQREQDRVVLSCERTYQDDVDYDCRYALRGEAWTVVEDGGFTLLYQGSQVLRCSMGDFATSEREESPFGWGLPSIWDAVLRECVPTA